MDERNVRLRDFDPTRVAVLGFAAGFIVMTFWIFVMVMEGLHATYDGRIVPTTCEECATDSECEALCPAEE